MTGDRPLSVVSVDEVLQHFAGDRHVKKAGAAEFLGMSHRWVEQHLDILPHFCLPSGVVLFRISELRQWIEGFRVGEGVDVDRVVDDVLRSFREVG